MAQIEFVDGRSLDEKAAKALRQEWLLRSMHRRRSDFVSSRKARVFCGTYNVNAKRVDDGLQAWLLPCLSGRTAEEAPAPDVYALGFQEIVDLNAMNVALDGSKTITRSQFWIDKVRECLASRKDGVKYSLVESKHLVGLLLCVFVKSSLTQAGDVRDVRVASTAVGVLGMGNKGGVAIRLHLFDTSLCFVCSHLAAHRENVEGRNADYRSIVEKTLFSADPGLSAAATTGGWVDKPLWGFLRTCGQDLKILDHDCVFWVGDLNYRIDAALETQRVFDMVDSYTQAAAKAGSLHDSVALDALRELASFDQLNAERQKPNGPFPFFSEGPLLFKPTYKYQPGLSDTYDTRNPKKVRAPAWCDRVLWREADRGGSQPVMLIAYDCANLLPSDHKPVYAILEMNCDKVQPEQEKRLYAELSGCLLRFRYGACSATATPMPDYRLGFTPAVQGNSYFPILTLSTTLLQYSGISYLASATQALRITNAGAVLAPWRFVGNTRGNLGDVPAGAGVGTGAPCRRWVSLSSTSGLLLPGESISIEVTVTLDTLTAQNLAAEREVLNDELLLRCENGHEYLIGVTCSHLRSCFGMSLEALVANADPVRLIAAAEEKEYMYTPSSGTGVVQAASDYDVLPGAPSSSSGSGGGEMDLLDLLNMDSAFSDPPAAPAAVAAPALLSLALSGENEPSAVCIPATSAKAVSIVAQLPKLQPRLDIPASAAASVPNVLWRMLHALRQTEALHWPGLFDYALVFMVDSAYPDPLELLLIRECLSCGTEFPADSITPQGLIVVLGQFLRSLSRPLLPPWLLPVSSLAAKPAEDQEDSGPNLVTQQMRSYCKRLLQQLPTLHYNTFVYVMSYLRLVLSKDASNLCTAGGISDFCAACMTQPGEMQQLAALKEVLQYLLTVTEV